MLGRADIEESKSGVAAVARPPQASYPCGNFSVTPQRYTMQGIARPPFPVHTASCSMLRQAFALVLYGWFPSPLSPPLDACVVV